MQTDPRKRFSDRVENYVKYRPDYPAGLIPFLERHANLTPQTIIADVGSGTGLLTRLFLDYGAKVFAIEPNPDMRAAAEEDLTRFPNFVSSASAAEETGLEDDTVDMIVAGQAYHWFDRAKAKSEFRRILKPAGAIALIWNTRDLSDPFVQEYEELVAKTSTDYGKVTHTNIDKETDLETFFSPNPYQLDTFPNQQIFDLPGLVGRSLSSSYAPLEDHPSYPTLMAGLTDLFERYSQNGEIVLPYVTEMIWGRIHK